jgi:hypothetical protein
MMPGKFGPNQLTNLRSNQPIKPGGQNDSCH